MFMSPYISTIFDKIAEAETIKATIQKDTSTLSDVINKFKTNLGEKLAPRIIFPIVNRMVSITSEEDKNNKVCFSFVIILFYISLSLGFCSPFSVCVTETKENQNVPKNFWRAVRTPFLILLLSFYLIFF